MRTGLRNLRLAIHRARQSPSDFLAFAFTDSDGRRLKQAAIHVELQHFLSGHSKALIELPRDHGKSVQMCGRVVWELGTNPGLRVKIVCATEEIARQRSRFLRDAIGKNAAVRVVFPELLPATPWAAESFTVARPADTIGPSVAAFGIGAGSTGARADLLICDDIVDVRSLHSKAARQKGRDLFHNNLMNLLEPGGRFWGFCTPWHADDLNAHLKRSPSYAHFRRAIGPNLEPLWPEKWSTAALADRRAEIGESSFTRGYRLLAISDDEVMIRSEWIRFWNEAIPRERFDSVILSVDPAVSAKASADATGLVVLGKLGNEIRVLAANAQRVSMHQLADVLALMDSVWEPDTIVFESNAAFDGIKDLFVHHTGFGPRISGHKQHKSKACRIAVFGVSVQNGSVKLKGHAGVVEPGQQELFDEMASFPFGEHDDLIDATASGVEYLLHRREPRLWG